MLGEAGLVARFSERYLVMSGVFSGREVFLPAPDRSRGTKLHEVPDEALRGGGRFTFSSRFG